jgi:ligand-binding sensor domain-containing protein
MTERDAFENRLRAALLRHVADGPTGFDALGFARVVAAKEPRRHGFAGTLTWRGVAVPRLAWTLLLLAALLAAMVAGMLFVGSQIQQKLPAVVPTQRPALNAAALAPTGIDVLTPDPGAYGRTVVDGTGIIWAREDGGLLVRFDPATGSARTWTVRDDAAFETTDIAPAGGGGVWLVNGSTLRRFDGDAFRDVIEAPAPVAAVVEAPDATLWAATPDGLVLHWSGSSWTTLDPGRPVPNSRAVISAIAVDTTGRTWIGWSQDPYPGLGAVSRFDGSGWTTFNGKDAAPLDRAVLAITPLPDGVVWVATYGGLARFDGTTWTDEAVPSPAARESVAAGPDGTVWAADGANSLDDADSPGTAVTVVRFDGRSWFSYGMGDGLPSGGVDGRAAWIAPTKQGVFVGTGQGIFRLAGDRWERAWPPVSQRKPTLLLAVSRDELWARDGDGHARGWSRGDSGLLHYRDGSWTSEPIDPGLSTYGPDVMAYAPDGTLWAAGEAGVAYLRDGRWTVVDTRPSDVAERAYGPASAIAFDQRGTVWVAGTETWAGGFMSASRLWTLSFDGTSWSKQTIEGCPLDPRSLSLAIDRTGALWVGDVSGGLARFDGRGWETIGEIAGSPIGGATVLGIAPDGAAWMAVSDPVAPADDPRTARVKAARFDGKDWTVVDLPTDYLGSDSLASGEIVSEGLVPGDLVLAPDGTLWASTYRGPAHLVGRTWSFPYADRIPTAVSWGAPSYAVARDGTVFGQTPTGIARFPAAASQP